MDSNIDPQIAASASPYAKYTRVPGSQAYSKADQNKADTDNEVPDEITVDTATQALKVLAYQMPPEDKHKQKTDKNSSFVYYENDETERSDYKNDNDDIDDAHHHQTRQQQSSDAPSRRKVAATSKQMNHNQNNLENALNFVMMDPSTKAGLSKRLGRPRQTLRTTETPQQSSLNNSNDSIISRFRFDSLPVSGTKGRLKFKEGQLPSKDTSKSKNRKVIQHADGFKMVLEDPSFNSVYDKKDANSAASHPDSSSSSPKQREAQSPSTTIVIENIATLKAKGRSTAKDDPNRFRVGKAGTKSATDQIETEDRVRHSRRNGASRK